jgi:hypothetical protein
MLLDMLDTIRYTSVRYIHTVKCQTLQNITPHQSMFLEILYAVQLCAA